MLGYDSEARDTFYIPRIGEHLSVIVKSPNPISVEAKVIKVLHNLYTDTNDNHVDLYCTPIE